MKYKYHLAFLDMAERFGLTSEATRLKVGAMIVNPKGFPVSCGVNGTPRGWHSNCCEGEDGKTLPEVRHAEKAALDKLRNSTETAEGCTMYISHAPCVPCAIEIIDAGIKEVWYKHDYRDMNGVHHLRRAGVIVVSPED